MVRCTKENLISEIKDKMSKSVDLPGQAASIGFSVFLLMCKFGLSEDPEIQKIRAHFIREFSEWGHENVLENQIKYAIEIAEYPSLLETEEIYKIFHLCDQIYGLEWIGLSVSMQLKNQFEKSIRGLFSREARRARLVAGDCIDDWSKGLWWYAENQ